MLNRWEGIGNLGKDPETRYTTGANPTAVCRYSIAVEKGYGENKKTVWVNIVSFGKRAESDQRYLAKGKKVYVSGELDIREYDKQDGTKGYITEVTADKTEYLSPREQTDGWPPQTGYQQNAYPAPQPQYQAPPQQQAPAPQQYVPPASQVPPQGQYVTREQYEAEKQQQMQFQPPQPQGFTALQDDDIPF